jgi:hypothetical protein
MEKTGEKVGPPQTNPSTPRFEHLQNRRPEHSQLARLCHVAGGESEQIQFLLGHVSVQTMEHYLGCRQRMKNAVNDGIGIEAEEERLGR